MCGTTHAPNCLFDGPYFGQRRAVVLEERWFDPAREVLPDLAKTRGWPIHLNHCFKRVLLDHACGGPWRDFVIAPAYRNAPLEVLERAVALGEAVAAGEADVWDLNRRSLAWRGKGVRGLAVDCLKDDVLAYEE